ncbi:hypothetical protein [Yersinia sp. Marseille-Q3913]|uniref:hypothetical protein n=1 Tax=Yersinia sp. Marseille-Q3913 TaxID=2830769 RepID=UPI002013325E|nr:hypothetical protein [Yersinia sp. Marseille-Q3913]
MTTQATTASVLESSLHPTRSQLDLAIERATDTTQRSIVSTSVLLNQTRPLCIEQLNTESDEYNLLIMDKELNLSTGSHFKEDDWGDYTACIIWLMHCRSEIRSGNPYQPMPKPIYPEGEQWRGLSQGNTVNIGIRKRYSLDVLLAIYQFHRAGHNENLIASDTAIPVATIRKMLKHKTQNQRKAWQLAHQLRIPSRRDIINRLRREV